MARTAKNDTLQKEVTHLNIIESFSEFKDIKNIDKATL